jgi:hypothetical protein
MDYVLDYMLKHKIAITQRNYIEIAYMGEKSLEELEAEELAELPDGFDEWPIEESQVN